MSRKILFSTLPLLFIIISWSPIDPDIKNTTEELAASNHLIALVNHHRQSLGKPVLIRNSTADKLAEEHANYMMSVKDVNNANFEYRWETLEQKENAEEVSENMGYGISVQTTMDAFLNSIWLKVNVEGDYTHTGIAVKKDDKGQFYYTQIFYR